MLARAQNMGEQIKKEIAVMKMVKQRHVVNLLEVGRAPPALPPAAPPHRPPRRPSPRVQQRPHARAEHTVDRARVHVSHVHASARAQVLASRTKIFIVLELVTGGELFDRIVSASRFGLSTPITHHAPCVIERSFSCSFSCSFGY